MARSGTRATAPADLRVAEPAAAYDRRPRLVADATVLAAALFGEAEQQQAAALLQARALCVPYLADHEIANVALKKLRRERLAESAVLACLEAYASLDLERHAVAVGPVFSLAQRYQLTAYDAAYLWLAEQLQAPLATFDVHLAAAAQKHLAVRPDPPVP
jgi:predicted nucleic acid-binding protein